MTQIETQDVYHQLFDIMRPESAPERPPCFVLTEDWVRCSNCYCLLNSPLC